MKDYLKSYHMYVPGSAWWIKLIMYLVYPIVVIAGLTVAIRLSFIKESTIFYNLAMALTLSAEMMADLVLMAGISNKDGKCTVFLRTTNDGIRFLEKALVVDIGRRISTVIIANVVALVIATVIMPGGCTFNIYHMLLANALVFAAEELAFWITRRDINMTITAIVTYCATTFVILVLTMLGYYSIETMDNKGAYIVLTVIFSILTVVFAIFRIKGTKKAGKEGYYD